MTSLRGAITRLLADPEDQLLARTILGTEDGEAIALRVEEHLRDELGSAVVGCPLFTQSVGCVFVLDLDSGERVVLKVHGFGGESWRGFDSIGELEAVYAAQAELAELGFRCARIIRPPRPFGPGAAAIQAYLAADHTDAPHSPEVRRALAVELARTVELGGQLQCRDRLPRAEPPATLFARPHNALFDLSRAGGDWIDARARAARDVLDTVPQLRVVMHSDFSCANVRVAAGRVAAVYDVDSMCWIDEMRCLGSVAIHFTYAGDPPWTWPTRDEARAFVDDYVTARGRPLDAHELARLDAAAIYAMAYTARCEHGHHGNSGQMQGVLAAAADRYFLHDGT